jgi:hypothetical protein
MATLMLGAEGGMVHQDGGIGVGLMYLFAVNKACGLTRA